VASPYMDGVRRALPIVLGYVPVAFAFGVLAVKSNIPPALVVAMSVFHFAGSGQFVCAGLWGAGVGAMSVIVAVFVVNLRHLLMSAAMAEPLACCLHGIDAAGIRPGSTVCVIGGGAIGLLMVQLARLSGAAKVILSEPVELRRSAGLSVGADLAVDPLREDLSARVREAAGKSGADVVIECVGNTAATRSAFEAAGFGATVLLFSVPAPTATVPLPLFDVYKKELAIRGSFINPDTHLRAVELLSAGRINVEPLITHTFGIGEMEQAIKMQMGGESIKVMVLPNKR